jgi:hypothetical protein
MVSVFRLLFRKAPEPRDAMTSDNACSADCATQIHETAWGRATLTDQTAAFVEFEDAVQEIFAVQVVAGCRFTDLINDSPKLIADSFVLPDKALDSVPVPIRRRIEDSQAYQAR